MTGMEPLMWRWNSNDGDETLNVEMALQSRGWNP
jgi:hypothetical protein